MDFHLSFTEIVQLVIALSSMGGLCVSICNGWRIQVIHRETNSMKDELVAEVREASFAKGKEAHRIDVSQRKASADREGKS